MEDCPKVGVFWSHNGRIRAGTALVKDGEDDGFFINYPFSHYQYWNILQKNYPELKILEYDEVPRGRVIFSKEENMFLIYMDRALFSEKIKQKILREFALDKTKTRFGTDMHYTTGRGKINKLLKD